MEYAEFVYLAATSNESIETLSQTADGAAYPAVRPEVVRNLPVVRPNCAVLAAFSRNVVALLQGMGSNESETKTLESVRDALLPKLISGEIRVGQAERVLESVT